MNNADFVIAEDHIFKNEDAMLHVIDNDAIAMVSHVDKSIENALASISKLTDELTIYSFDSKAPIPESEKIRGFSGYKFRHLMNNLCNMDGANYLEVGVFRGSTLISAVYGNEKTLGEVHAIDNYSEFAEGADVHPRDSFNMYKNLYLPDTKEIIQFHESDCFEFDISVLPKIDIYFYDGEHSAESQYKAFKYFEPAFSDVFIAVVDDWEQKQVRNGTKQAFEEIDYDVVASRAVIPGKRPNNANRINNPTADWWCGVHLSVLKKRECK